MTVYRSAHGRPVDIAQLATKFEKVRAVGNMNVNARGDVIDNENNVVKDNTNRVKKSYNNVVGKNPTVQKPKAPAQQVATSAPNKVINTAPELSEVERELFNEVDDFNEDDIQQIKSRDKK